MNYLNQEQRVPFFRFEDREHGEDVERSTELGYAVPKMVTFILLLPHGSKDTMDFMADEFIARKETESHSGRYPNEWVKLFKEGLALYRQGKEIPRSGTPLITWERLLKSRRTAMAALFPTVEDLATVPDSALGSIGLDGRVIRDMARLDIQAKTDLSPVVKELAIANETIRQQEEQLAILAKRLDALEDKPSRKKASV